MMGIDYDYIIILVIAVLLPLADADFATVEFSGQIVSTDGRINFAGEATIDHRDGDSVEINYRHKAGKGSWKLKIGPGGDGELTFPDGSSVTVNLPAGVLERKEAAALAGPLSQVLRIENPKLVPHNNSLFIWGGRDAFYTFDQGTKRIVSLLRYTDPSGLGAPQVAKLKLGSDVKIRIKFERVKVADGPTSR